MVIAVRISDFGKCWSVGPLNRQIYFVGLMHSSTRQSMHSRWSQKAELANKAMGYDKRTYVPFQQKYYFPFSHSRTNNISYLNFGNHECFGTTTTINTHANFLRCRVPAKMIWEPCRNARFTEQLVLSLRRARTCPRESGGLFETVIVIIVSCCFNKIMKSKLLFSGEFHQ